MLISSIELVRGSVAEWLERGTCNSEAPSSSLALTASWICSIVNSQLVCLRPVRILNPVMFDYIWIICFSHLLGSTSIISAINTAEGK